VATQKEVAKLAGVSFITVSRVINNEGNVKEETRLKVEQAIRTLGYFPSYAGKALNSGKNQTIGVMTPARFGEGLENSYLMGVLRGISLTCRERGQDILLSPLSEEDPDFDYLRPYLQRKVDGMIYVGLRTMTAEMIKELEEKLIPCVVLGDRPPHEKISWIDTDNERSGYETAKRIWEKGHRIIAFHCLTGDYHNENFSDRERGFKRAILELSGKELNEELIIRASYEIPSIKESIRRALETIKPRPTAIFCASDSRALAALHEIQQMGLTVPGDISLVGFDGFLKDYVSHPTIATNEQPLTEMGKRATEILLDHIANPALPKQEVIFPVVFLEGQSLGACR
jgi:LacI family transcriptional regulator